MGRLRLRPVHITHNVMKGIVWCALALLGAVDLWDAALAAQAQASGLGLTEAFAGKDSQGLPAVFALGLVLAGAPLDSRSAVPAYEDCATACRLDGACVTFMYCGEPVRLGHRVPARATAAAAGLAPLTRSQPVLPTLPAGWLHAAGQ